MRGRPLKATSYISINGAEPVPFDSLSPEERDRCVTGMMQRMADERGRQLGKDPELAMKLYKKGLLVEAD